MRGSRSQDYNTCNTRPRVAEKRVKVREREVKAGVGETSHLQTNSTPESFIPEVLV